MKSVKQRGNMAAGAILPLTLGTMPPKTRKSRPLSVGEGTALSCIAPEKKSWLPVSVSFPACLTDCTKKARANQGAGFGQLNSKKILEVIVLYIFSLARYSNFFHRHIFFCLGSLAYF